MGIVEMNELRASLGLRPLINNTKQKQENEKRKREQDKIKQRHKELESKKEESMDLDDKIQLLKELHQQRQQRLVKFKNLGDSDSDDDGSALTWVKKARRIRDDKLNETKIAHFEEEVVDSDMESFTVAAPKSSGITEKGNNSLNENSVIAGVKVLHTMEEITEKPVILTFADSKIVSDGQINDEDELHAVELVENAKAKRNSDIRAGKRKYDIYNDELKDTLLPQYDIDDEEREKLERKNKAIVIGESGTVKTATDTLQRLTEKLEGMESSGTSGTGRVDGSFIIKEASDYYTKEEMTAFKKPKEGKKRKLRKKEHG